MPHYTHEQPRAVMIQTMDHACAYYRCFTEQNRPAVERAIENLTGQSPADDTAPAKPRAAR